MTAFVFFILMLTPVLIGVMLMGLGDKILKKIWNLPDGKWSLPASSGWMLLTGLEMGIAFFLNLFILMGEIPAYVLVIDIIIYIVLSALILILKIKK